MKLTIFNGSPRGEKSNTKILLENFCKGFQDDNPQNKIEMVYLNQTEETANHAALFQNAEHVILAFPLYTDAMPGIVKRFIDALVDFRGSSGYPSLGFIIQSGFPEPNHCRTLEKYLEKLARRMCCKYTGTVIKGGVEGLQVKPPMATRKLLRTMARLGTGFSQNQCFDPKIIRQLARRNKFSAIGLLIVRIMIKLNIVNLFWDSQLKKHNAYEKRFARPYTKYGF